MHSSDYTHIAQQLDLSGQTVTALYSNPHTPLAIVLALSDAQDMRGAYTLYEYNTRTTTLSERFTVRGEGSALSYYNEAVTELRRSLDA